MGNNGPYVISSVKAGIIPYDKQEINFAHSSTIPLPPPPKTNVLIIQHKQIVECQQQMCFSKTLQLDFSLLTLMPNKITSSLDILEYMTTSIITSIHELEVIQLFSRILDVFYLNMFSVQNSCMSISVVLQMLSII